MGYDFTFETQGINTYMVYSIKSRDKIDYLSLGMLINNKIPGIAPVRYEEKDNCGFIKYNISSKVTVEQFFWGEVSKKRLIGVFSSITYALLEAEDYMIEQIQFLLDTKYIFVDVKSSEVLLLCFPIEENKEEVDLKLFFKKIMFSIQFDQNENCDYVAQIINYLNKPEEFSLSKFQKILNRIKEDSKYLDKIEIGNSNGLSQGTEKSKYIIDEAISEENSTLYKSLSQKLNLDLFSKTVKGRTEDKGKWFEFGNKRKKGTEITTLLSKMERKYSGNTTDLSKNQKFSYLIRESNGEKIIIDKDIFRLGKEETFVDYYIDRNNAVSRSHAQFVRRNGQIYVMDTNSTNHTFVNGKRLERNEEMLLIENVEITLGNEKFKFIFNRK